MKKLEKQEQRKNQLTDIKTFPVPFPLEANTENIIITTNNQSKPSKEQIINQAFKFHSQGNIPEATRYYQYFINRGFNDHRVFFNYGVILINLGKIKEAEISIRQALELKPDYPEGHLNLGNILRDLGKLEEAEISIRKALKLKPDNAMAHLNLGNILRDLGKIEEAVIFTRKALKLNPNYTEAHVNLGNILKDLGNLKEAELSTRKAIELKPDLAGAHSNLGLILLQKGEYEQCIKCCLESAELLRGRKNQRATQMKSKTISKAKIDHDIEQFEYLESKVSESKKFTDLVTLYKKIAAEIKWESETKLMTLSNKHQSIIEDSYNLLINQREAPKLQKGSVNNLLDVEKITNDYYDHEFGLTYIDNFLTPEALESLREFLLESTIWFDIKKGGYLGAYLNQGLATPLIIQIADELRKKFPKIFKDHYINQIWAYKYDSRAKNKKSSLKGINIHADFAAVNVNFWITPKEANLNPNSGGLIVYDVEAPKEWDFKTFNNNEKKIREELKKSKGNTQVVPHNENRAVIFNSNLFHETDSYEFKEGYENRRINVTMLFGKRSNA